MTWYNICVQVKPSWLIALMPKKTSFPQKIVIAIALPVLTTIVLMVVLLQMDLLTRKYEANLTRQENFIGRFNHVLLTLQISFNNLFSSDTDTREAEQSRLLTVTPDLSEMNALSRNDPRLAAAFTTIKPAIEEQLNTLFLLHSVPQANRELEFKISAADKQKLRDFLNRSKTLEDSLVAESNDLNQDHLNARAAQQMISQSALIVSALLVILVFVLGYRLALESIRSINVLLENSTNLALRRPLKSMNGNDELNQINDALMLAARLTEEASERRNQMVQMITHDLRSPLFTIVLIIDKLMRTSEKDNANLASLKSVKSSAERMTGLAEDFLLYDQLESGDLTFQKNELDVREIVDKCIDGLTETAENAQVKLLNKTEDQIILSDERRFEQILTNLLANAIRFSPKNGTVEVNSQTENSRVKFSVIDEGPGMSSHDYKKVFERHFQVAGKSRSGFGLGLTIVKFLVEGQNGLVGARAGLKGGTEFWFELPV